MDDLTLETLWNRDTGVKYIRKGNFEIFVNINSRNKKFIRVTGWNKGNAFDFSHKGLELAKEYMKRNGGLDAR